MKGRNIYQWPVFLFLILLTPGLGQAQCGPTCTSEGCPEGQKQGIGNAVGIYDKDCNEGSCLVPCEPMQASLTDSFLRTILEDLKAASTDEELSRIAAQYRTRLLLNGADHMVVALGGCPSSELKPVSMVHVSEDQLRVLQAMDIERVQDRFPLQIPHPH